MKKSLLLLLLGGALYAGVTPTTTLTTFEQEVSVGKDKYGNAIFDRDVKIDTQNYKVDNFWKKFSFNGEGQESMDFTSISKTGTVRISVESTSICTLYDELDTGGCSGQKPFLINSEALLSPLNPDGTITLMFQKDYNGTDILYTDNNASVFYPLDVDRVEKYYKHTGDSRSHFSFFEMMFNTFFGGGFFSGFFDSPVVDSSANNAEDIRQRYISNIVSGIDQEHLLEIGKTPLGTNTLNDPVSLIDYVEDNTVDGSCNLFFFRFSEDNFFCNIMGSMPFISMFVSENPSVSYEIDTIQSDTENALITFAGAYAKKDVTAMQESVVYEKQSSSSSILGTMVNAFKCMFFGCTKINDVEEAMDSYYSFNDDEAINLTFAVVDTEDATSSANKVDDLQTFQLKGIHSLTGNEHTCQVKESTFGDKWSSATFTPNSDTIEETTASCDGFYIMGVCMGTVTYTTSTVANTYSAKYMDETTQSNLEIDQDSDDEMTPSEWLTWCDYMVDKYKDDVKTECTGFFIFRTCKEVPADIKEDGYEILSYTNTSKRGLFLDLKPIELTTQSKAVTLRYNLISTK